MFRGHHNSPCQFLWRGNVKSRGFSQVPQQWHFSPITLSTVMQVRSKRFWELQRTDKWKKKTDRKIQTSLQTAEDSISLRTFIVDLKANWAHTLIRLKVKPHLMRHADNQVWDKTSSQPADYAQESTDLYLKAVLFSGSCIMLHNSNYITYRIKYVDAKFWKKQKVTNT